MITIQNEQVATIPTLHVVHYERMNETLPTIFFLHGLTSAKEHNLHVAYLLAEKGFRIFLPDALHHGEREEAMKGKERERLFWEIVQTSIKELDELKTTLEDKGIIAHDRIGVIGTSMGAITMYGALATYDWIKTAVSFMGTAYYEHFANSHVKMLQDQGVQLDDEEIDQLLSHLKRYDLTKQLEKTANRPLFIWHGKEDRVVPYTYSEQLYDELLPHYKNDRDKLLFVREEHVAHKVSREAILRAVKWFNEHL